MTVYNIAEAKAQLSALVARAEAGESVVIARAHQPRAVLVPVASDDTRSFGQLEGLISVSDDFDAPMDESEAALWE